MNRKFLFLCTLIWCSIGPILAGDVKTVSIHYEYLSDNPNETPDQAEQTAIQRARLKAMEEHFGLDVSSVSSIMQRNRQEGKETSSSTDVFALRETAVRGEWIETIRQEVESKTYENGFWHVKVYVEGRARNHSKEKVEVKYALINNMHDRINRDQYYDGDELFLRFSTPVSGSLLVYLVDEEKNVFCMLPYRNATTGCYFVEANTDYLFFSDKVEKNADGYVMTTNRSQEQNAIYIIFSPHLLTKANDQASGKNWRQQDQPRQLSYEDFVKWLSKNQLRDEDMVVLTEVITIRK